MFSIFKEIDNNITSASGEYMQWEVSSLNNFAYLVYLKKSMILCSPSPGTEQSE